MQSKSAKNRQTKRARFQPSRKGATWSRSPLVMAMIIVLLVGVGGGAWVVARGALRTDRSASVVHSVADRPAAIAPDTQVSVAGAAAAAPAAAGEAAPTPTDGATPIKAAAPFAATDAHEPYPEAVAEDGVLRLPLSEYEDGHAHHYTFMNGAQPIEFFVIQSADGVARAAFNACDVCFLAKQGYTQDGDEMICNNCGRRFPSSQINVVQGGCNPAPLRRRVVDDLLVITVEDLIAGAKYF